jgi:hypothetical protein
VDSERRPPVPVARHAFLRGVAGLATIETGNLLARGSSVLADQRASVTIDLPQRTGRTLQPYLYGYATGALLDNDFRPAANTEAERSAQILAPMLLRFNTPVSGIIQAVFAKGVSQPDWTPFSRWARHHADFLGPHGRLIFGIGPAGGDTSIPPATWAQYARATALHFRHLGQEIAYWEVGNECDPMGPAVYSGYFNAIADALHSVNPACLVGGPVASWWNGIDLPAFVSRSGRKIGFIDFHSYPVSDTDPVQTAYEKAVTFTDVASARQALAGTTAASLPIGLLEYNMNGNPQPDGTYGLPSQGTITGAVYAALLLTRAFTSDPRFTMSGLWDLIADSHYGAIGNASDKYSYRALDQQGRYLSQAATLMPGHQVHATTTAPGLQVLATTTGKGYSIQLVNYHLTSRQTVTITIKGTTPGSHTARWELSAQFPNGHTTTITNLNRVQLPPDSIVILRGKQDQSH